VQEIDVDRVRKTRVLQEIDVDRVRKTRVLEHKGLWRRRACFHRQLLILHREGM